MALRLRPPALLRVTRLPNGWRVSGERGAEGDERVRCTRMLGRTVTHSTEGSPRIQDEAEHHSRQTEEPG